MLITLSGMVGSGKSTTAALIMTHLAEAGLNPRYLRFRYIGLFGTGKRRPRDAGPRGQGFSPRRLKAGLTLGYVARILAFRVSRLGTRSQFDIFDRYFYDNLVHYGLKSRRERLYALLLKRLIPRPDLAIVLVASEQTISMRRQNYAHEYVEAVARRYTELPKLFPDLIPICTDPGSSAAEDVRRLLSTRLSSFNNQNVREVPQTR